MERALVSLPDKVKATVDKLKGKVGEGRSGIIRTIVIAYLSEKGYLRGDKTDQA